MTLLVSFEGIDGSGKTSLIRKLSRKMSNSFTTKAPRGTKLGLKIWKLINDSVKNKDLITDSWTQCFLLMAAHNEHIQTVIKPNLKKGKLVLTDRYVDSSFVYQGTYGGLDIELIQKIFQIVDTPFPDLTFILDIEPIKAQMRLVKRKEINNWDNLKLDSHRKIREGYLSLEKRFPERIKIINADRDASIIIKEIVQIIKDKLNSMN